MNRIQSFDFARGFTVLMMPMIHVVILYSKPQVQQSLLGDMLGFIAEGPGAQLFMLLMGVSFTFSKRISTTYVFKRAFYLLVAAYLLNFFKFILPLKLGFIPENLLAELALKNDSRASLFFLLIGDILHFAGVAYLVLYLISRIKHYQYWSVLIAIAIIFLSPYIWDLKTGIPFVDQLVILFNGHPPQTFFPVFPWLVYPLVGLSLGYFIKQYNHNSFLKRTGIFGVALVVVSLGFPATTTVTSWLPFYRTEPADTIFHIGFVLIWIAIVHWISRKIKDNPFFRLLSFCSRNITVIYLVQWIMICWCLAFTGYLQLNFWPTIAWMIGITTVTLLLTYVIKGSNASSKSL